MRRSRNTLPGDPFRLGHIRLSRVLWLSVLAVMLGGLLEPEAAAQAVSFGPKTDFGTGGGPHSVAVGDFNGDGSLDLAVANAGTVSILLGTGTGSFGANTDFGTGADSENLLYPSSASVAVGDFNGDGKLDLAVANFSGTVSILLGTGTGSFGAKTDFNTAGGDSVAVGDFNGDGKLDLAVANFSGTVSILLGTGTGSFGAKTDFPDGDTPSSVAAGDFNGDGKLDLAVANYYGDTVSILLGTGTGSFGANTDFPAGATPSSLTVGDFNSDGKLDLAVGGGPGGVIFDTRNTVSILLGTGTGSFGPKTDFDTGTSPLSVAVGDFNRDGNLDLAVANFESNNTVSILLGMGTGSFGAKTDFGTGSSPYSVAVGDFNGDGKLDLAVANYYSATVSILLNTSPASCAGTNPIDCAGLFVRQHYRDFLNREPDQGGLDYWTDRITQCGSDARCIHERRIGVSGAFFVEMEFQDTGYYVYRFYKVSFGRQPNYAEFTADRAKVIGGSNLEANKQAFADEWVQRSVFRDAYPSTMSNTEFVNKLFDSAGLSNSIYDPQRQQEILAMNAGRSRALVLRDVIEIPDLKNPPNPSDPRYPEIKQVSQYNPAFVLMQYFGYLRRNVDQDGYAFWLDVVNNREPNNYHGMICSFITSSEYQLRFGTTVTRSNADCGP